MLRRSLFVSVLALASLIPLASAAEDPGTAPRELLRFVPGRVWAPSGLPTAVAERAVELDFAALMERSLLLPLLDGRVYRLEPTGLDLRGPEDYALRGEVFDPDGGGEAAGTATLTVRGRQVRGLISLPGAAYQIVPAEDGTHRLVEVDDSRLDSCATTEVSGLGEAVERLAEPVRAPLLPEAARRKPLPPSTIRILVLHTPEAAQRLGGRERVEMLIQGDVDLSNTSFANTGVPLQLELAGIQQASGFTDSGSISQGMQWLANETLALRRQWNVPTIVLITANLDNACGVARLLRTAELLDQSSSAQGHAIVASACLGTLTFAHEIGHTLGCEHDPANGNRPQSALFPYGFGHFVDGSFRTVMSYSNLCTRGCPRIPYFSNPVLRFGGLPVGVRGQRDNSRVLHATRSRFSGPPASQCQTGPNSLCLQEGRFKVQVEWLDSSRSRLVLGRTVPRTDTAGLLAFRDPAAPDLLVRVSGTGNGVTFSYGALTSLPFRLSVTDLTTLRTKLYYDGACGGREVNAFPADVSGVAGASVAAAGRAKAGCRPGPDTLCLHGRFQVQAEGPEGPAGAAEVSRMAGTFDFGDGEDPELAVKIIPQGKRNFDLLYGTLTDREYTLTVTDTRTGVVKTYHNAAGSYCGGTEGRAF